MARVVVNPEIIRWAIDRTKEPESIFRKFPMINKWLKNEGHPTLKQLENLAKATYTPLGYFFLSKPPEIKLPIPYYRTIDNTFYAEPSPNLIETVQTMQQRQLWMREYLLDMGYEPLHYVGTYSISDDHKEVAKNMRKVLGIQNAWAAKCQTWEDALNLLIERIEEIGVIVFRNGIVGNNTHRKLDVNEFRGFVLVDEYVPLMFINSADSKAAQMFTIAHELAHIWYGESAAFDLANLHPSNQGIEEACNLTAAEFLVPEEELRSKWNSINNESQKYNLLARYFKVSSIVIARRALDLKLISREQFFDFYNMWAESDREQNRSGGNFYYNQRYRTGRRFAEAVFISVKEGRLLYNDAYRLMGLRADTFSKYAKHLGIEV